MKRAVSISIGSSKRDKQVEVKLLGETVSLERIGTDGDMEKAARLYEELDGKVDAFGVGGAVMGLLVGEKWYSLPNVQSLTRLIHITPVVDGTGLKSTLEYRAASVVEKNFGDMVQPKRALLISGVDRYGLTKGFIDAGYEPVIGDMMFTLGINMPIHTDEGLKKLARNLIPLVGRLPFSWLYPTGEAQEERKPKWTQYFGWATLVAGDCHYITRYMPDRMDGKIVVTNTTTVDDRKLFKDAGIRYLVTSTPIIDGRSFGTNMLEAGLIAAMGRKEPVDYAHPGDYFQVMESLIDKLDLQPQVMEL